MQILDTLKILDTQVNEIQHVKGHQLDNADKTYEDLEHAARLNHHYGHMATLKLQNIHSPTK